MTDQKFFNNLLNLYDNITVIVDLEKKQITSFLDGSNMLHSNISYDEFTEAFARLKNLNEESKQKILRFLTNLNPPEDPISMAITYTTVEDETIAFEFKGLKYSEKEIMLIFSNREHNVVESHEPLTRVYTKEVMFDKVKEALNEQKPFVLMIIDLDHFKSFNDTYGHMFGDIVLVETAASIKKFVGNNGFIGRLGGDEFLLLAYIDNDYDIVHKACTQVRHAINNVSKHNIKQATITATVGCASYPIDATDFDTLYKKCDKALARGKNKGRNCFVIYNEDKCGSIDDYKPTKIFNTADHIHQSQTNSNIVAGVFEILHRDGSTKKNIEDSLSLIGNYFLLDRIILATLDPDAGLLSKSYAWYNPRRPDLIGTVSTKQANVAHWRKSLDKTGMLKMVQIDSNKSNKYLYDLLKSQGTSSILAFEMKYMDKIMGLLRYDMCSSNRFWSQTDIASLMLISKIFSIFLNKEYENLRHKKQLYTDRLTGIYNYTKWRDMVFEYLANSEEIVHYSILSFDIDKYKHLSDVLGTKACDEAVIAISEALTMICTNDIYCRVTDAKFLVFVPNQTNEIIEKKYYDIAKYLGSKCGDKFFLKCGIYNHNQADTLTTAIDKANLTTKRNEIKQKGFMYFSQEYYEETKKRLDLELHMYKAKEDGEFLLYLQPKFNTNTGEVVGAEALTRWNYKHEKILTPNIFIPLFEQNGFIKELDYLVFENVCKFQRKTIDEGLTPVKISVNVSRYQADFDAYIATIDGIREKYSIDPSLIEIEITEGMYIDNINQISDFIKKLHDIGYSISMDDFGSGYSNLASLATLDFDLIKLDKGFCANQYNEKENIILSFVMALAKNLHMDVLCEGVETSEFVEYLKSIGCNLVQGFFFERPIPSTDFKAKYLKH